MNLLLLSESDRVSDLHYRVDDHRLQHLLQVHGAVAGDVLRVGLLDGLMGKACIEAIDASQALLSVTLNSPPPAKLPITLVLALPRPKMLRRVLRTVAEMGVPEVHLIHSYRVEKSYWQTPVLNSATTAQYLRQGLEQSKDTIMPVIHCHRRFKPFVEDRLPDLLVNRKGLLAHPGDYPDCPRALTEPSLLVVGPEGGLIPYEVDKLAAAGCHTVSLGKRILRVENALTALLARLY